MRSLLLAVFAVSAVLGDVAAAADLPIRQQPVPVYRKPVYFTGCYIGANVGTGWSWAGVENPNNYAYDANNLLALGLGSDLGTQQTAGLVGGLQGGCDYQVGGVVFGVQGMFDGASMKGNQIWQAAPQFANNGKIPWFGTVTGRVGFTFVPSAMFYGKAGVAWFDHDYSRDRYGVSLATGSSAAIGWTAGVGVEWIIWGTWSLWAEYNYIGIGERDVTFTLAGAGITQFPNTPATFPLRIQENINLFQVGFNYRFVAGAY
jgi:outer membrane immunogenic protein